MVQISILSSEFVPVYFLNIYISFNPEIAVICQEGVSYWHKRSKTLGKKSEKYFKIGQWIKFKVLCKSHQRDHLQCLDSITSCELLKYTFCVVNTSLSCRSKHLPWVSWISRGVIFKSCVLQESITPDAITSFLKQTVHQGEDRDFCCLNNFHFNEW